jgi:putative flavoprotein involved in K+ transport
VKHVTTVIIGAGQAGLAMSKHLADRSIDHVVIERGEVANSWRTERWDSLRLLTPNWQSRLPGYAYRGDDPDGYMDMKQVVGYLGAYASEIDAPVITNTNVHSVSPTSGGYAVVTDRESWTCDRLVLATGACNVASIPSLARNLPANIASLAPMQYRNPEQLDEGGVLIVGASATGVQLAMEIQASGRQVTLCVGEHVRVPRVYRGRDIQWWMDRSGALTTGYREVDDLQRARNVASLQLSGTRAHEILDINTLSGAGVTIVGRLAAMSDNKIQFSGSLANQCALADLKMARLLQSIDEWSTANGHDGEVDAPHRFAPTTVDTNVPLSMNLAEAGIRTVIWATGFRPDYSWLNVPVFDRKGRIVHDGGVAAAPGLYVLGLPFLRRRNSSLIDGVGADAGDLAEHLSSTLMRAAA